MTELQMVGVAERVVYEQGAEYEGLPSMYFQKHQQDMQFQDLPTENFRKVTLFS